MRGRAVAEVREALCVAAGVSVLAPFLPAGAERARDASTLRRFSMAACSARLGLLRWYYTPGERRATMATWQ
jgi:hypothetical protein